MQIAIEISHVFQLKSFTPRDNYALIALKKKKRPQIERSMRTNTTARSRSFVRFISVFPRLEKKNGRWIRNGEKWEGNWLESFANSRDMVARKEKKRKKEGKKERSLVRMRLCRLPFESSSIPLRSLYTLEASRGPRMRKIILQYSLPDIFPSLLSRVIASQSACSPLYAHTDCACVCVCSNTVNLLRMFSLLVIFQNLRYLF